MRMIRKIGEDRLLSTKEGVPTCCQNRATLQTIRYAEQGSDLDPHAATFEGFCSVGGNRMRFTTTISQGTMRLYPDEDIMLQSLLQQESGNPFVAIGDWELLMVEDRMHR
jgi:hypothetical protein